MILRLRVLAGLATALLACACAAPPAPAAPPPPPPAGPRSYVVLERNADGTTGAVVVQGSRGTTVIDRAGQAATLDGVPMPGAFAMTPERVEREFEAAIAARPRAAEVFRLYFETGRAMLTPASERLVGDILAEIASRPGVDVSIIGHTDTEGDEAMNERLGMERARWVEALLRRRGLATTDVTVASHGERNLLVRTPDNASEARNRRVEVIVR